MPMGWLATCLFVVAILLMTALSPGLAVDNEPPNTAVDLTSARQKIKAKYWHAAIAELKPIIARVDNADAYNLYAFSLRNVGDYEAAFTYYGKALDFDPKHKSAREYLGELYVITGDMAKAREQLAMLEKLCPSGCEELDDLRKAIGAAPAKTN
jgi:Flp pilus assembly protein TadD